MENCDCCKGDAKQVYCYTCTQGLCLPCNLNLHLSGKNSDHSFNLICEECEEKTRDVFCLECDEGLCADCDLRLHKKGTRVQHQRVPFHHDDNYKLLLNFIYLPGHVNENDIKSLLNYFQQDHIGCQLKFTTVHFYGEKNQKLSEFLATYNLTYKVIPKVGLTNLLDYFIHNFDKKVFLNNLIILSKEALPDDLKNKFVELFPSAKVIDLKLYQTIDKESYKETLSEDLKNTSKNQKTSQTGHQFSQSTSSNHPKNYSKEQALEVAGHFDTVNSHSHSGAFKSSLASQPKISARLSKLISQPTLNSLLQAGCPLSEYLIYYFGLKEWRHAPLKLKQLLDKSRVENSVPLYHIFDDLHADGQLKLEKSLAVQDLLKSYASQGTILVDYNTLLGKVCETLGGSQTDSRNLLLRMSDLSIIIINSRQFTQTHVLNQVSFKLEILTLEDLFWVTKSLTIDRVTATEEIVLARLKEAFGLKLKPKLLEVLLESFSNYLKSCHNESPLSSCSSRPEFQGLSIETRENPYVKNTPSLVFQIKDLDLSPEDVFEVREEDEDWINLKKFINELFDEELLLYNNTCSTAECKKKDNFLDKPIYSSEGGASTSNAILNITSTENQESASKIHPSSSITETSNLNAPAKAITGGRYGMAQLIKNFGPPHLSSLSVGRLSKLVQKSIDTGLLRYCQNFLLKNEETNKQTLLEPSQIQEQQEGKLKEIFEKLIECLIENKNYLPVAQLSEALSAKLGRRFDYKDYGYSKLTHFIEEQCRLD